jgi:hypothetical protein
VGEKDVLDDRFCHQDESTLDGVEHSDLLVGEQDDCRRLACLLHRVHPCDQI